MTLIGDCYVHALEKEVLGSGRRAQKILIR
jgi:hypothetical protein